MAKRSPKPQERTIPIRMETDEDSLQEDEIAEHEMEPIDTSSSEEETEQTESVAKCPLDTDDVEDGGTSFVIFKNTLPSYDVPEKIILVVDSAEDVKYTPFFFKNGQMKTSLEILKGAVEIFLHNKQLINRKHEYALVALNNNKVVWLQDFTRNITNFINALQEISPCQVEDILEFNSLFDLIIDKIDVPDLVEVEDLIVPPDYIVRTILLYGRSYTIPTLIQTEEINRLLGSAYFILDVLMTHEPVGNDNNCTKIFNFLQNLDRKGLSYFLPVARNAKTLFRSMGKLLGHPLQRAHQKFANPINQ